MPQTITATLGLDTRPAIQDAIAASKRINSEFSKNINGASTSLGRFDRQLDNTVSRILAFSASFAALGAVTKTIKELTTATIQVEKSLADINVILNASNENLKKFSKEIFNIAKNTGQSFNEVAKAATEFARQGLGVEETLKRTRDALILTRLSGLDVVASTESLTATLNSFKKQALDSTKVVNALANVDAQFAVSAGDLAEAIKRVGSSAEDTGVSFNSLIALVTSAKQITGREGAVIGNSFKTIFQRIQRPEVLKQLEDLGVEVRDFSGEALEADKILVNLAGKFDNLSSAQKNNAVQLAAGVFQANIFRAILSDVSKETGIYSAALKTANESTDQAIKRNEKLNETLAALLNRTKENFRQLGSQLGQGTVNPLLRGILEPINAIADSDNSGETLGSEIGKGIIKGLGNFITGPGVILAGGLLGKLFIRLKKDIGEAFKALTGINQSLQQQLNIDKNITSQTQNKLKVEREILGVIQSQNIAKNQGVAMPMPYGVNPRPTPFTPGRIRGADIGLQGLRPSDIAKINKSVASETGTILTGGSSSGAKSKKIIDQMLVKQFGMGVYGTEGYKKLNQFVDKQVETARQSYIEQNKTVLLNKQINEAKRQFVLSEQTRLRGTYKELAQQRTNLLLQEQAAANNRGRIIEERALQGNIKNAQSISSFFGFTQAGKNFQQFKNNNPEAAAAARKELVGRVGGAALRGSFYTSLGAGFLQEGIGDSSANRRGASSAVGLVGSAGANALAGSLFGPQGALIAGVGTLLLGLPKVFKDFNSILPDIARNLEKISEKSTRFNDAIAQVTELTDKLSNPQLKGQERADLQQKRLNLLLSSDVPKSSTNAILKTLNDSSLSASEQIKAIIEIQNKQFNRFNEDKLSDILKENVEKARENKGIFNLKTFNGNRAAAAAYRQSATPLNSEFSSSISQNLLSLGLDKFLNADNNSQNIQQLIGNKDFFGASRLLARSPGGRALNESIEGLQPKERDDIILGLFSGSGPFSPESLNKRKEILSKQDKAVEESTNSFKQFGKRISELNDSFDELQLNIDFRNKKDELFLGFAAEVTNIKSAGKIDRLKLGSPIGNQRLSPAVISELENEESIRQIQSQFRRARRSNFGNVLSSISGFSGSTLEKLRTDNSILSGKEERDNLINLISNFQKNINDISISGKTNFEELDLLLKLQKDLLPKIPSELKKDLEIEIRKLIIELEKGKNNDQLLSQEEILESQKQNEKTRETLRTLNIFKGENLRKGFKAGGFSGKEFQGYLNQEMQEKLDLTGKLSGSDFGELFASRFTFNTRDLFQDLKDGAIDFADTFKSESSSAFKEFALNAKSAGEALRGLGLSLFGKLLDKSIDSSFNMLFGGITSSLGSIFSGTKKNTGGLIQKFATGGKVMGGSGARDDVPAMLNAGEYVVKKDVVNQMGDGFFKALNAGAFVKFQNGGANVLLKNQFNYDNDKSPTSGSLDISSSLSRYGLSDENNPQNQIRMAREEALYQYLEERKQYEASKSKAMSDFKRAKKQRLMGAYISAGIGIAGAGFQGGFKSGNAKAPAGDAISDYQATGMYTGRANGGVIPGFANGGMSMDNVPAMLTGGEYVVRKDVVDRMGVGFFNRLNSGQLNFANGGMVGSAASSDSGSNSMTEMLNKLISINESIRDTLSTNNRKIDNLNPNFNSATNNPNLIQGAGNNQGTITNNVTISIVLGKDGKSESSSQSNSNDSKTDSQDQARQLGKLIEPVVLRTITEQQRPGGLLYNR